MLSLHPASTSTHIVFLGACAISNFVHCATHIEIMEVVKLLFLDVRSLVKVSSLAVIVDPLVSCIPLSLQLLVLSLSPCLPACLPVCLSICLHHDACSWIA